MALKKRVNELRTVRTYIIDENNKEYLIEVERENNMQTNYIEGGETDLVFWKQQDTILRQAEKKRVEQATKTKETEPFK